MKEEKASHLILVVATINPVALPLLRGNSSGQSSAGNEVNHQYINHSNENKNEVSVLR